MAKTKFGIIFDDGFVGSSLKTAEIFESAGLRATFAVLANPVGFAPGLKVGGFSLWNELKARGHSIQPHGYTHANLTQLPYREAVEEIDRCLDLFREKLAGFEERRAVWNYTYLASTPELTQYLLTRCRAVREDGNGLLDNNAVSSGRWHSPTFGPGPADKASLRQMAICRQHRPTAALYTLHGLDGVAWGHMSSETLRRMVETLRDDPDLEYWAV